jgi:hypothetical protein
MLITFFDIKGTVHFEIIPQGQTVSRAHYVEILKQLREAMRRKRLEIWPNDWILHHYNAQGHKALCVKELLVQKAINEKEHQPYSPHLSPSDFCSQK